jgi:hypothetical protein
MNAKLFNRTGYKNSTAPSGQHNPTQLFTQAGIASPITDARTSSALPFTNQNEFNTG